MNMWFNYFNNQQNQSSDSNYFEILLGKEKVGRIGVVHPVVAQKIDKSKYLVVTEINITKVNGYKSITSKVAQVSKYPTTTLDFNFVLASDEYYGRLEEVSGKIDSELSYKCQLVDIFHNVQDNTKSYTIRYFVTSMDHTLSSDEIENFHKLVISTFEKNNIYLKSE